MDRPRPYTGGPAAGGPPGRRLSALGRARSWGRLVPGGSGGIGGTGGAQSARALLDPFEEEPPV
ncbi:hypothetical protein [Streptomyces poriticola]|uniref:hypothetical protein n=1 Tax=Streptomyces poriticola TaxID=3120506 RepID=UPI0038CD7D90